jgi:serine/threonine protein kinase
VKIADFGLSKFIGMNDLMATPCGTPEYIAPEVLRRQKYDKAVDMWSLGVILYILLCGYPPFGDDNQTELFRQIKSADFEFDDPIWDTISDKGKDLVRLLLNPDPLKRYTVKQCLAHPWMRQSSAHKRSLHKSMEFMKQYNQDRKSARGEGVQYAEELAKAIAEADLRAGKRKQ